MRDKIEVWPKLVAIGLLSIPSLIAFYEESSKALWALGVLSVMQLYVLIVNDERVFDIHQRLRELEKREEKDSE